MIDTRIKMHSYI